MPMSDMVVVTREFIMSGRSPNGAWTRAQLALIGVPWPPVNGWISGVIGTRLSQSDASLFLLNRRTRKNDLNQS